MYGNLSCGCHLTISSLSQLVPCLFSSFFPSFFPSSPFILDFLLYFLHCLCSCPVSFFFSPSRFLFPSFTFALAVLFSSFFLSFLLLSRHCPSLNNYFLHCSSGLLFAGQSQVNCVCSLSICFCV